MFFSHGSYDALIGMDWLERHQVKIEWYNKTIDCINDNDKEDTIVIDVSRTIIKIFFSLEDWHEDNQSTTIEIEGKIVKESIFVLIDIGSSHSYVIPKNVKIWSLKKHAHHNSW